MLPALVPIAPKLAKLLLMLSSDQPGEVVATAHAIGRTLRGASASWHDLAQAIAPAFGGEIDIAGMLRALCGHPELSEWEARFIVSVTRWHRRTGRLTERQAAMVRAIYEERAA
jgi:hypothetical protein